MARSRAFGLALLLVTITAAAEASPIGDGEDPAPPSTSESLLARIGRLLAQPSSLQIVLPQEAPTFRVEVHEHLYWTDEPPLLSTLRVPPMSPLLPPRSPGDPTLGASGAGAGVGIDPYAAIASVRHFFQQRAAEKEVREVVAELCAVTICQPR